MCIYIYKIFAISHFMGHYNLYVALEYRHFIYISCLTEAQHILTKLMKLCGG
jgi:hypothetical protein